MQDKEASASAASTSEAHELAELGVVAAAAAIDWVETVRGFGRLFKQAAGRSSSLVDVAVRRSRRWFQRVGGGSNRLCIGHRLDAEPSTDISVRFPLEDRGRLARSTRCPATFRRDGPVNLSRQLITRTRRSSRYARSQTALRHRERIRWSIAATDEFVGV